jgi:anthranilate synthase component 1
LLPEIPGIAMQVVKDRTSQTRLSPLPTPTLEDVRAWLVTCDRRPVLVPIYREIMADSETPVSAYLRISDGQPGFILESVEGGERIARYSFIGANPFGQIRIEHGRATVTFNGETSTHEVQDPLRFLEDALARFRSESVPGVQLPRFDGGAVGYLSYEAVRAFEPRVGVAQGPGLGYPDAHFMFVDSLLVFDNVSRTIKVVSHMNLDEYPDVDEAYLAAARRIDALVAKLRAPMPSAPAGGDPVASSIEARRKVNTDPLVYRKMVETAREYIAAGDIFQVVLSQRVDVPTPAHPFTIYRALRTVNPSPYMFYLDIGDHYVVGASPELLVRVEDGVVTNHPIAGTRPRGADPDEDAALARELLGDEKERAEHIMLVDLGRNDVGRVSKPGSVRVPRLMEIERFSHVMHIVSNVEGDIRDEFSPLDALRACFPAGTVSGAPKVRAMEIIAELEVDRRGVYSGAVGYVSFNGTMDTCIALRTLVYKDGIASLQAGGGIVLDSTPDGEYAESFHKMRALVRAIELAESIEIAEAGQ